MNPACPLPSKVDIETVRFSLEGKLAESLTLLLGKNSLFSASTVDGQAVRRRLMAAALRLTDRMAPAAYGMARQAASALGLSGTIEIYQSAGQENAAIHMVEAPILVEIQGRLLSLLDGPAGVALFGHELGHYLAHGPNTEIGRISMAGIDMAASGLLSAKGVKTALGLSVAKEITADRIGLLACGDLDAALRLEMIAATGLSESTLNWDTKAYLAQCRELIEETLRAGDQAKATTHPEHSLRAWALWLFSETEVYCQFAGGGLATRKLVDIDALIERALGSSEAGATTGFANEMPAFAQEFALAASVLVAQADGVVAPEELAAIEDAFGSTVPGWSEFLDPEVALERFHETGSAVTAGGVDWVRAVFTLLTHIINADDVVEGAEIEMLLAIGEAIGYGPEFRKWIQPVMVSMGATIEIDVAKSVAVPLPSKRKEVVDAFAAFARSVVRQGSTRITVERLLRLLGAKDDSFESRERLTELLKKHSLRSTPELDDAQAGQLLELTSQAQTADKSRPPIELPAAHRSLIEGLSRLRDELVSGDGRSLSVRLRRIQKVRSFDLGVLNDVAVGRGDRVLQSVLGEEPTELVSAEDAGRHTGALDAAELLGPLERTATDRAAETGAADLFVGYPLIVGCVGPRAVRAPGYPVRAPLVLYPVELVREGRGARGYSLRPRTGETPIVNQSLLRLVFNKLGFAFPDELGDELNALASDPSTSTAAILTKLQSVGLQVPHRQRPIERFKERNDELETREPFLETEPLAILGIFPQSNSDLLQDYDALLKELGSAEVDLGARLAAAVGILPSALRPKQTAADHPVRIVGNPVLESDPSQRQVAQICAQEMVTVVDGPPGTGKSQLIVNLVADAIRAGKKVAVVAEKRAALDVVHQRLSGLGFGSSLALVHDVNADRKPLYQQVNARLRTEVRSELDQPRLDAARAEHANSRETLESHRALMACERADTDLCAGELMSMAACSNELVRGEGLAELGREQLKKLQALAERLHPRRDLWRSNSWWATHPSTRNRKSLAAVHGRIFTELDARLGAAVQSAQTYEKSLGEDALEPQRLLEAGECLSRISGFIGGASANERSRLLGALSRGSSASLPSVFGEHRQALEDWKTPRRFADHESTLRAATIFESFGNGFRRFFSLTWWKARGAVRRSLVDAWPEKAGAKLDATLAGALKDRAAAGEAWAALSKQLESLGVGDLMPVDLVSRSSRLDDIHQAQQIASDTIETRSALDAIGVGLVDTPAGELAPRIRLRVEQATRLLSLVRDTDQIASSFPATRFGTSAELIELRERLRHDGHALREVDAWFDQAEALLPSARTHLTSLCTSRADRDAQDWREVLACAWARDHLTRLELAVPELGSAGTLAHQKRVEFSASEMTRSELTLARLEADHISATLDHSKLLTTPHAKFRARRTDDQRVKETLLKETGKKRSLLPMRSFVRRFSPAGLLDVLPVWLLSPETVAVLFPREPLFDLVIFDEASQCTVANGFPAMLRAKQVVVAGDEKQMPPTSYFALGGSTTEDADRSETERAAVDAFSSESLLALARTRCVHAGLQWHYRCRHEELIAFSNHSMYDGELMTIPAADGVDASPALKWIHVEDGCYDAGLNRPEARRVVQLVGELLAKNPEQTIGVVTFNLKQRQTILDTVDERIRVDEKFAALWGSAMNNAKLDERPFVKNLESVQGDERDVIIFSLGHAPIPRQRKGGRPELYVPARFGPLGQKGGERRLNVAISRAKVACYVVSSFDPALLHVGNSTHAGPQLFKGFLEFAYYNSKRDNARANRVLDNVRGSARATEARAQRAVMEGHIPLAQQIALVLETRGVASELSVGSSRFRVPLAVRDPTTGRMVLAVMTDEGRSGGSAFEQFVHQPSVLKMRGWGVIHVDAASWLARPTEVVERVLVALEAASLTPSSGKSQ